MTLKPPMEDLLTFSNLENRVDALETAPFYVPAPRDDETVDTLAIQAKVDEASAAGGGTVILLPGTYTTNATITLPSFITLTGLGPGVRSSEFSINTPGASVLKLGGAKNFIMVTNADSTNGNSAIVIRDIAFHQNVTPDVATVAVVQFSKVRRSLLHRVSMLGGTTTNRRGLYVTAASEITFVHECFFEGCGVHSTGSSNTVRVMRSEIGQGAVYLIGGYGHHIDSNEIFKDGISSDDTIGDCIRLDAVKESRIAFNNVRGAYNGHGTLLNYGCYRNIIHANHIYENGRKTAGVWSGIQLDSANPADPTEKNLVTENVCYDRQATKTQQYGIVLKSASGTQTNYNTVRNNILLDNRSADAMNIATAGLINTVENNRVTTLSQEAQINNTDSAFSLTPWTSAKHTIFTAVMAAGRIVTLNTTNAVTGYTLRITRTAASTGAFNLDVGGLKNLATSQWCEVTYTGAAWTLTAFGSL